MLPDIVSFSAQYKHQVIKSLLPAALDEKPHPIHHSLGREARDPWPIAVMSTQYHHFFTELVGPRRRPVGADGRALHYAVAGIRLQYLGACEVGLGEHQQKLGAHQL